DGPPGPSRPVGPDLVGDLRAAGRDVGAREAIGSVDAQHERAGEAGRGGRDPNAAQAPDLGPAGDVPAGDGRDEATLVRVAGLDGAEVPVVAGEQGSPRAHPALAALAHDAGVVVGAGGSVRLEPTPHACTAGRVTDAA